MQMVERDGVNRSWWMDRKAAVIDGTPPVTIRAPLGSRLAQCEDAFRSIFIIRGEVDQGGPRSLILYRDKARTRYILFNRHLQREILNFNVLD
jgi:hypothetical protein